MGDLNATTNDKYASINKVNGGFIVNTGDGTTVTTSLQKAIKIVRDYVGGSDEAETA